MRKRWRLWLIGIAVCLVVGVVGFFGSRRSRQHPGDTYISKLFGGNGNIQVVAAPESIQAWQTVGFLKRGMTDHPVQVEQIDFYVKGGEPVSVGKTLAAELSRRLSDFRNYDYDSGGVKSCLPEPGFVLTFSRAGQSVDVFFCFECDMLIVRAGGGFESGGDFDPSHNELLRLIKQIFPNNADVQRIGERPLRPLWRPNR